MWSPSSQLNDSPRTEKTISAAIISSSENTATKAHIRTFNWTSWRIQVRQFRWQQFSRQECIFSARNGPGEYYKEDRGVANGLLQRVKHPLPNKSKLVNKCPLTPSCGHFFIWRRKAFLSLALPFPDPRSHSPIRRIDCRAPTDLSPRGLGRLETQRSAASSGLPNVRRNRIRSIFEKARFDPALCRSRLAASLAGPWTSHSRRIDVCHGMGYTVASPRSRNCGAGYHQGA